MAKRNTQTRQEGRKRYRIEMSSVALFLWGFCLLFFVAWIFVLGVLVGRGFLPGADSALTDLKSQVSKLQEVMAGSKPSAQEEQKKEAIDEKLAFYERLESKKDETKKIGQLASDVKEGSERKSNGSGEPLKTDPPEKEKNTNSAPTKSGEGSVLTAPPAGKGVYTLQIASLEDRQKAQNLVKGLTPKGYDAYFYEVSVKGKPYYRVRCGRFTTREKAREHASKLLKETGLKGLVRKID
jgi:septal ring-binding cell division protein DamX